MAATPSRQPWVAQGGSTGIDSRRQLPPPASARSGARCDMQQRRRLLALILAAATQANGDGPPSAAGLGRRHDAGFVGVYHSATGNVADGGNTTAQAVGNWGVVALANHGFDGSLSFEQNIELNCRQADVNVLLGMVIAHSEGEIFNNSNDTDLLRPHNTTPRGGPPPPGGPYGHTYGILA